MAILVLDDCKVGVTPTADGNGFMLRLTEGAIPVGVIILIPFEGEMGTGAYAAIHEILGPKLEKFSPSDLKKEVDEHEYDPPN